MRWFLLTALLLVACPAKHGREDPCGLCRGYVGPDSNIVEIPSQQGCPLVWDQYPECRP